MIEDSVGVVCVADAGSSYRLRLTRNIQHELSLFVGSNAGDLRLHSAAVRKVQKRFPFFIADRKRVFFLLRVTANSGFKKIAYGSFAILPHALVPLADG